MYSVELAFLGGVKAGLEALVKGLEIVVEDNAGQVSFDFIKLVSTNTIKDVEEKLSMLEGGDGLIRILNDNRT